MRFFDNSNIIVSINILGTMFMVFAVEQDIYRRCRLSRRCCLRSRLGQSRQLPYSCIARYRNGGDRSRPRAIWTVHCTDERAHRSRLCRRLWHCRTRTQGGTRRTRSGTCAEDILCAWSLCSSSRPLRLGTAGCRRTSTPATRSGSPARRSGTRASDTARPYRLYQYLRMSRLSRRGSLCGRRTRSTS